MKFGSFRKGSAINSMPGPGVSIYSKLINPYGNTSILQIPGIGILPHPDRVGSYILYKCTFFVKP
jgi:hypothetical protein